MYFPSGQTVTTFDQAGRVTNITNKYGSALATSSSYNLTLSAAGYPVSVAAVNNGLGNNFKTETQTYDFDSSGRLKMICYNGTTLPATSCGTSTKIMTGVKYTYDAPGNITARQTFGVGAATTNHGYSASDQLCWYGTATGASTSCTVPTGNTSVLYNTQGDRRSIAG
ncbi:MAG: hypothetical protein WD096_10265, partial [Actinomycetota bacterium]